MGPPAHRHPRPARRPRAWARRLVAAAIVIAVAACGTADRARTGDAVAGSVPPIDAPIGVLTPRYELLDVPGWELDEAVDLSPGEGVEAMPGAEADWYAEYRRDIPHPLGPGSPGTWREVERVMVSAYDDDVRPGLDELGIDLDERVVDGRVVTVATSGFTPTVVVVDRSPRQVVLLSYELDAERLLDLVPSLVALDEDGWLAVGSRIR